MTNTKDIKQQENDNGPMNPHCPDAASVQPPDWTIQSQDWLPVKLVRAMFDLRSDLKTRNHPEDYIGDWRQVTYEEVHRATGLSKNKVKGMYRDFWFDDQICIRVHRPKGTETSSEVITGRDGVSDVPMHIMAPWLRFNYDAFSKYIKFSLECEKYGREEAFKRADERKRVNEGILLANGQ